MERNSKRFKILGVCRYKCEIDVKWDNGLYSYIDISNNLNMSSKKEIEEFILKHYKHENIDNQTLGLVETVIKEEKIIQDATKNKKINEDFLALINAKLLED